MLHITHHIISQNSIFMSLSSKLLHLKVLPITVYSFQEVNSHLISRFSSFSVNQLFRLIFKFGLHYFKQTFTNIME